MAKPQYEVVMQVVHPYHDADGTEIYYPGQQFPQDEKDLPEDLRLAPVIVESDKWKPSGRGL
jgi:hypothetical protein